MQTLGTPKKTQTEEVVDLLDACHERMRRFCAMARRLAAAPVTTPASEIGETATALVRYFTLALPLHVIDEEQSILPRLPYPMRESLEGLHGDHQQMDETLGVGTPLWRELAEHPSGELLARLRDALERTARMLGAQMEAHLQLEEALLFPAVRALSPEAQAVIREEMRARRQ